MAPGSPFVFIPFVVDLDQECKEVDVTSHLHSLFFLKSSVCSVLRKVLAYSFVTKFQSVDLVNGIKIFGHLLL